MLKVPKSHSHITELVRTVHSTASYPPTQTKLQSEIPN